MPMKSQEQRRYLHAKHPKIASEFEKKTPKGKTLPKKVSQQTVQKSGSFSTKKRKG